MARSGLWYRREVRAFRSQSPLFQGLAVSTAILLVAGLLAAIVHSSSADHRLAGGSAGGSGLRAGPGGPAQANGSSDSLPGANGAPLATLPNGTPAGNSPANQGGGTGTGGGSSAPTGGGGGGGSHVDLGSPQAVAQAKSLCGAPVGPGALTASDRGVTSSSITVAFPYFDPTGSFALTGTSQQSQPESQSGFIQAYVDCVNAAGGIGGRMIVPEIQVFNPLDEVSMRALCLKWTQNDHVFAVLDSAAWFGQNQLCIAKDNQTPLISGWTTVSQYTAQASPYLWWTAPTAEQDIDNVVLWARDRAKLTSASRIGIVTTDRPTDQIALPYMKNALAKAGFSVTDTETFAYDRSQAAAQATLAADKMAARHVDVLLPLLAFDSFAFWLQAAEDQSFFPRYLLSDYEQELVVAQALLGGRWPKSLQHAQGPTFAHLGEPDFKPKFPPTLDAAESRCEAIWHREHPGSDLQVAGVDMRWCDTINLFVEAARRAGPNLTRPAWAKAMATIHDFGAGMTPTLTYGPGRFSGPTQMRIVDTVTSNCPEWANGTPCTLILEPYGPLRHF